MASTAESNTAHNATFPTIDALLAQYAQSLKPGESISIPLYKGNGTITTIDPLQANKAQKAAAAIGAKAPASSVIKRHEVSFPKLCKFIQTVERPDFQKVGEFQDGRLYMEDIPKAKDDSDEEEAEGNPSQLSSKKRWRKNEPPKQHWVLQPMREFTQKFKIKQFKAKDPVAAAKLEQEFNAKLSKRYHGLPEANSSQYIMLEATNDKTNGDTGTASKGFIRVLPMHGFINFTQPAKFKTLSMQEAEQAISSKKSLTRYMMHSNGTLNGEVPSATRRVRLMEKLKSGDDTEDADVMDDLCFREPTRSSTNRATSEILDDLGDGDIKVDADGILGGANDSEFGGKRRFGRIGHISKDETTNKKYKRNASGDAVGIEAAAMQEDFYQRDVGAEYDELDYDPNEQFDDDDVDVGAEEVVFDESGGFAADIDSDSGGDEEEEADDFDMTGFEAGFATSAGMKAMIAKANGEDIQQPIVVPMIDRRGLRHEANVTSGSDRSDDEMQSDSPQRETQSQSDTSVEVAKSPSTTKTTSAGVQLDENGLRVITKEAVRREIWLHNGSIKIRKLAKVYKISGKASKERQELFKKVCKELCTAKNGVFILKQHYSKME